MLMKTIQVQRHASHQPIPIQWKTPPKNETVQPRCTGSLTSSGSSSSILDASSSISPNKSFNPSTSTWLNALLRLWTTPGDVTNKSCCCSTLSRYVSSANNSYAGAVAKGFAARGVVGGGPGSGESLHERDRTPVSRITVPIATNVICRCVSREVCW